MNIVIYSPNFYPMTGGLEHAVLDLAGEFSRQGQVVTVITHTPATEADNFPFQVLRNPRFWHQTGIMRRTDLVLQFNVSLKGILPWLFSRKPLVVSHQTPYREDIRGRIKTWIANHVAILNIGCSNYMSRRFRRSVTIPNPYNHELFGVRTPWERRARDLIFVGRLVSDKGADLILQALALLRKKGMEPGLSIVGSGPEAPKLKRLVQQYALDRQVTFPGLKKGPDLVEAINLHRIMVVPSVWEEPFGIVALEGLACGCIVIGSNGGGLPEAMGGFGMTFPNRDVAALAACLESVLKEPGRFLPQGDLLALHLERHQRSKTARQYLKVLGQCIREQNGFK